MTVLDRLQFRTAHRRGDSHPRVKYSDAVIASARMMRAQGLAHAVIAATTGMPTSYVRKVTGCHKR